MTKRKNETLGEKKRRLAYLRDYRARPENQTKEQLRYTPKRKQQIVDARRLRIFGITRAQFDALAEIQSHRCAVCGALFTDFKRGAQLDHCHLSGLFRGLLCPRCNTAEGSIASTGLQPDEFARRLIAYLANPPADRLE